MSRSNSQPVFVNKALSEHGHDHLFNIWKQNMPNSIFINLGDGVVLTTKCEKDINEINRMYYLNKDQLYTEVMSKSWYRVIQEE